MGTMKNRMDGQGRLHPEQKGGRELMDPGQSIPDWK
jgi:hypothetical protein